MPDLAFDVPRQVALPGGVLDQDHLAEADHSALAVTGGYFDAGVKIDDVLAAWCGVPVDVVLRRGLAKDNPVLRQSADLEQCVNLCRTKRQQPAPLPFESTALMALAAFVAHSKTGRRGDTGGPPDRLSTLSPGMTELRLTAAAVQLPDRDAH
jgi:hypothetical protein